MNASMCGCVSVWVPTCRGADKLQNQGPAGDNSRSTGQKVPEKKNSQSNIKISYQRQCKYLSKSVGMTIGTIMISQGVFFSSWKAICL